MQYDFWLGHSAAATVANVKKASVVGTSERTVRRLLVKFCSGDTEIGHKSGAGRPVRCNVDDLQLKVQARSTSTEEQRLQHKETCKSPQQREVRDPFLHRILTGVEKWLLYNHKRKARSLDKVNLRNRSQNQISMHKKFSIRRTAKTVDH
ncbi:hypothetical protein TNCV_3987091 [Trichonephila clavipes]|nr:hypothetical protein TNCV_3987091 [Trichonephila clavipes]